MIINTVTTLITIIITVNITIRARAVAYFYLLAFVCLAVAQMFLGYVYFPTTCGNAVETCKTVTKATAPNNIAVNATTCLICWSSEAVCGIHRSNKQLHTGWLAGGRGDPPLAHRQQLSLSDAPGSLDLQPHT